MKRNLKLTLAAAAIASALASPAWSQPTTDVTGASTGTTAAQARLHTECFNASTKTWRTTGNCANVSVDTNGMPNTVGTAPVQPMPPTANTSSAYPANATKPGMSSQNPGSLKDQSGGSAVNSTTSSTSSSIGR